MLDDLCSNDIAEAASFFYNHHRALHVVIAAAKTWWRANLGDTRGMCVKRLSPEPTDHRGPRGPVGLGERVAARPETHCLWPVHTSSALRLYAVFEREDT